MKRVLCCILLLCLLSGCGAEPDGFHIQTEQTAPAMEVILASMEATLPATESTVTPTTEAATEPATEPVTEPVTEQTTESVTEAVTEPSQAPAPIGQDYVLNRNTKKFHLPSCGSVRQMKAKNRRDFFGTRQEVLNMGYVPCKNCKP